MSGKNSHGLLYCAVGKRGESTDGDSSRDIFTGIGEYPSNNKTLTETVNMLMNKIPKQNHKRTLTQTLNHFHYKVSGDLVFFCVSKADYPMRIAFALLDDLETQYLRQRPDSGKLKNMLKTRMAHFNNTDNDKILQLHGRIEEVKGVMMDNIDKVLSRGEALERLVDRTEELADDSHYFRKGAKKLKNRMILRNILIICLIIIILLLIILLAVWIGCGFPSFWRCRPSRSKKKTETTQSTNASEQVQSMVWDLAMQTMFGGRPVDMF